jgi:thioesterase domain-containing protein
MQPSFFVLHDTEGTDAVRALAGQWQHTGIALRPLPLQDITPAPDTLEGLAARAVHAMQQVQPAGPYRLAGWRQGGLVAYEAATQLVGRDQVVEFIGLVGPWVRTGDHVPQPSPSLPVDLFAGADDAAAGRDAGTAAWQDLLPPPQLRQVTIDRLPPGCGTAPPELTRALAAALTQAAGRVHELPELQYWAGLTIQTGQRGHSPLFCIPGAGDSVTGFASLAAALGRTWPVHGLQPRGMEGQMIPHATVEAAAQNYLRAIEALQPQGPIHLLGHSFGGWVAYEVATRLCAARRPPASLTLVDSEAPGQGGVVGGEHTPLGVVRQYIESLELVAGRPLGIDRAALEAAGAAQRLQMVHAGMVRVGLIPARSRPETLKGGLRTFATTLRTDYQPQRPYPGPMRLVIVADPPVDAPGHEQRKQTKVAGWRELAPQLSCWKGPGNHMTVLKPPHAAELVRWWLAGLPDGGGWVGRLEAHSPGSAHALPVGQY